jgi:XRE family transcriptional regulator, aerobic/anaerobic benzoate catabolism transcriptional regulator
VPPRKETREDPLLARLGRAVREARVARGLTLRELAARSGLSSRFLVQVEGGRGNLSVRSLAAVARALGTTPAVLLAEGAPPRPPVIALLGLRGAGKTTLGRRLARRLHRPFVELDRRIERAAGLSLGEIFSLHGEEYYRRLERHALEAILDAGRPVVVATGGGLVTSPETYALLRQRALTVWLRAEPEDHWNRVVQQGDRRPMADHPQAMAELRRLLSARESLYAEAEHTIDTSRLGIEGAMRALEALARRGNAAKAGGRAIR